MACCKRSPTATTTTMKVACAGCGCEIPSDKAVTKAGKTYCSADCATPKAKKGCGCGK